MRFKPHEYQQRAIDFVNNHTRCALFLEMGLGKTVSTLSAVSLLIERCLVERVLVIAPKKVAESTWDMEIEKWDHLRWLPVSLVTGSVRNRERALSVDARIYVMGRNSVAWLDEYIRAKKCERFDMVIIDELTSFKNPRSIRFKALRRILEGVERVVGLTGTPAPQGLIDLWGQMYCIDRGERLGRYITRYRDRYFHCVTYNNIVIKTTPKQGAQEEIMEKISDITLTMRTEDWLTLPPITITDIPVRLSAKTLNDYHVFERDRVMEITGGDTAKSITAESAGALVNKLMQYANGAIYTESHEICTIHQEKVLRLCEILESEDSPLLCFYWYKHDLDAILKGIPQTVRYRVYENKKDMEDWNKREIDLLLAHPLSTSYGLNMQKGGSRIVWYAPVWNLELYQQANARLHRQGQERPVRVFNLVSLGTVDERIAEALRGKNDTQANILKKLASSIINNVK